MTVRGIWSRVSYVAMWVVATLVSHSIGCAADEVVVRSGIRPDGPIWVGQRTVFVIDVLGRDQWAHVSDLPVIDVAGCSVIVDGSQGVRLAEQIDGNPYSGQRYEFSVFPHRSGTVDVSEFALSVSYAGRVVDAESPALSFVVTVPDGVTHPNALVTSSRFSIDQSWSHARDEVSVGDAVKREIHFSAVDVSSMAFLPVRFSAPDGVGVYVDEPGIHDRSDRGALIGERTESATYVFQRSGTYELPAIRYEWWHPTLERLSVVEAPAKIITVSGAVSAAGDGAVDAGGSNRPLWIVGTVVGVLVAGFFLFVSGRERFRLWVINRRTSEPVVFRDLLAELQTGCDATSAYDAIDRWLRVVSRDLVRPLGMDDLMACCDTASYDNLSALSTSRFGGGGEWTGAHALARQIVGARLSLRTKLNARSNVTRGLPPMNP